MLPGDTSQDRIIYARLTQSDVATVLQVDPRENTLADLQSLFRPASPPRAINTNVGPIFTLRDHHSTPADGVADWALNNNTDAIPANKFESLGNEPPATWADGTAFNTINTDWLPAINDKPYDCLLYTSPSPRDS